MIYYYKLLYNLFYELYFYRILDIICNFNFVIKSYLTQIMFKTYIECILFFFCTYFVNKIYFIVIISLLLPFDYIIINIYIFFFFLKIRFCHFYTLYTILILQCIAHICFLYSSHTFIFLEEFKKIEAIVGQFALSRKQYRYV